MGNVQPPSLPQHDKQIQSRHQKLEIARENYQLEQKTFGLTNIEQREVNVVNIPPMLRKLPKEEQWSFSSLMKFALRYLFYFLYQRVFQCCHCGGWTIRQMINHFRSSCILKEPKGCEVWRTEFVNNPNQTPIQKAQTDHWFAWQRLNGVTRNLIKLATEIPQQFGPFVEAIENDHQYLGGKSLKSHIQDKTLFVVDLADVSFNEPSLLSPIALFVTYNNLLMPVAIRIDPGNPNNNEVFMPPQLGSDSTDKLREWVKGRMWFNMLDAQYHESVTHLGFTHLLMEGISACMHRNISERHPIYELMLPHFRYMHFINELATKELIEPGGYVDRDMYFGQRNMMKLIAKHNERWSFEEDGSIERNFRMRGVMDIPGYFFRDDALQLLDVIQKFVHEYVTNYYKDDQEVLQDQEIQAFRAEVIAPRSLTGVGGCGMLSVPEFDSIANVVTVLANFIYICSVEHSATNFPQYEQYAFPPNMPAILNGQPELETGVHELDVAMPTGQQFFSTIKIMMVLTTITTNSLGNYESVYLNAMDSAGRRIVQKFQQNLIEVRDNINQRNSSIENSVHQINEYPYDWLLPANVRNSISI
ncbi:polyunsaturated fatty acid lipoxygenase ALOX15B-like [Saccostrea echinata]|uniref:polyunsaturated fatty acid lipoxygenase ALOX15B-like n=1 Tax=Saccostrea echinata TaxID=191078 RepID=UPI002A7ECBA7|nr:polyunsaturated fatty acid lipoxygenase ALOX15B-like [Saccostrea echinata]